MALNLLRNARLFVSYVDIAEATFTGSISGTELTVTSIKQGTIITGSTIVGTGVTANTTITSPKPGTSTTGGVGTYIINNSQTVSSTTITSGKVGDKTNTWEIPVLNDFSFSQSNETQDISLSESGATPSRATARFNTGLNPVDWSFTSYMRPYKNYKATRPVARSMDRVLWLGLISPDTSNDWKTTPFTSTGSSVTLNDITDSGTNTAVQGNTTTSIFSTAVAHGLDVNQPVTISGTNTGALITGYVSPGPTTYYVSPTNLGTTTFQLSTSAGGAAVAITGTTGNTGATGGALLFTTNTTSRMQIDFSESNTHKFTALYFYIKADNIWYKINYSQVNQAEIDFSIDNIGQVKWSGLAKNLLEASAPIFTTTAASMPREYSTPLVNSSNSISTTASIADFIIQKYTTLYVTSRYNVNSSTNKGYAIPITGGSLTINNNITYLTPENLSIVNEPYAPISGARDIMGSITCYLKTGTVNDSSDLLNDLLSSTTSNQNAYELNFKAGGNTPPYVQFSIPNAMLSIPTVDVQDVLSLNIDFKATSYSDTSYSITSGSNLTNAKVYQITAIGSGVPWAKMGNSNPVSATALVAGKKYIINTIGTTDWYSVGALSTAINTTFVATGPAASASTNGDVYEAYFIKNATVGTTGVFSPVTAALTGIFTSTGVGLALNQPVTLTGTNSGALITGYVTGTTYYVISTDLTNNTFRLSTTLGGSSVAVTGTAGSTGLTFTATVSAGTAVERYTDLDGSTAPNDMLISYLPLTTTTDTNDTN